MTPNHAASGNGAMTLPFQFARLRRAVPEPVRSASSDRHQWDFDRVRAPFGWVWVGALVSLLAAAVTPAEAGENKGPRTFIPNIARIAGIKVGYSSMEELEGRLGKGKVAIGGHSNGARLWRVKGTSWLIYADAFEYSERGAVVDSLNITVDPRSGQDVPYAHLARNELACAGSISLGLDEDSLLKVLKQKSWTPVKLADGWLVTAQGHSPLTSDPLYPFNRWEARFTMKGKSVVRIHLDATWKATK
jgi:hypothetical protein